jgi:hypothetical protein
MSIVLVGSTSGSCTLQEQAVAGTTVLTLPTTSGTVMVNGPAFSATPTSTSQTPTASTFTKVTLGTELFDTNNNFTSSTFTPTVAGYYQINCNIDMNGSVARLIISIYKNGTEWCRGFDVNATSLSGSVSQIMYLNGSTDYVELYTFNTSGGVAITGLNGRTCFSGSLVRGA